MKKMMKLFIALFLLINVSHIDIYAQDYDNEDLPTDYYENMRASDSIDKFKDFLPAVYSSETDTYAGAWIDPFNIPHIAFTEIVPYLNFMASMNDVKLEKFTHSFNELSDFQHKINEELSNNYLLVYTEIKEETNSIEIGYKNSDDLEKINRIVEDLNTKHINVSYELSPLEYVSVASQGGSQVHNNVYECGVGFPAKMGLMNGFVTAGHCFANGTNTNLGQVKKRVFSAASNMDAEFINSNIVFPWKNFSGRTYLSISSTNAKVGAYAYKDTYKGSKYGKIISISKTTEYKGEGKFENLIRVEYPSVPGESGSVVISNGAAIGIVKGTDSKNTDIVKSNNIIKSLGLTISK